AESAGAGRASGRPGLVVTPEDRNVPQVPACANELHRRCAATQADDAIGRLRRNPRLRDAHRAMLTPPLARPRGEIDTDLAIARAKIDTFETQADARSHLTAREKMAALADPPTFDRLMGLAAPRADDARAGSG